MFRAFKHNYHDGALVTFTLGPRRELTLEVELDPVWNPEVHVPVRVRFGGIENYDEVVGFFNAIPKLRPDGYFIGILDLKYLTDQPNWAVLDLDHCGDITIHSHHIREL